MPCKCSGVRYDRCGCGIVGGYQTCRRSEDRLLILTEKSACRLHTRMRSNIWCRVYTSLYERCAGYNLRYCPLRGVCTRNFVNEALRDLAMLLCFLIANFVVFLTIFARLTVHVSFALVASGKWIRRCLLKKIMTNKEVLVLSKLTSRLPHDFTPPPQMY